LVASVHSITFDCANPKLVADFWSEVTGFVEDPDDPNLPEHEQLLLVGTNGTPNLLFIIVPEGKTVKNRVHLDIQPADRIRDEEVERLLTLGATIHEDHRQPDGRGWVTMADPEGNEFCVERSAAERAGG
jgi:catechol 2,3-dioxygenase-like lactoylglutathione lyase family enzyme